MNKTEKTFAIFENSPNKKLINKLEADGNKVFKLPQISIEQIESEDISNNEYLSNLDYFDWVIFPDVFSVDVFLNCLEANKYNLFELDNLRVCAYGEAVSDRLRFVQLHADIITKNRNNSETFLEIENYLLGADQFQGLKMLIIKDLNESIKLEEFLKNAGSRTVVLNLYKSIEVENAAKLKSLTIGGAFDEFIFSTPDDVFALAKIFYPTEIAEVLNDGKISATNEITLQTLVEFGLIPKIYK